jgi:c-di-GMP-binding flagellar brake protein YcgR
MNQRYEQRKSLSLDITIAVEGKGKLSGRTMDISLGGMAVDIGRDWLEPCDCVDIIFNVDCGEQVRQCRASAVVMHSRVGYSGLAFSELDSTVKQMLRKRLFGYATVSQRAYLAQSHVERAGAVSGME